MGTPTYLAGASAEAARSNWRPYCEVCLPQMNSQGT
jgi:hypothetical protein